MSQPVICGICGSQLESWASARLIGKHAAAFLKCVECGSIQTEEPYWLAEAYASALTRLDIGQVVRFRINSFLVPHVHRFVCGKEKTVLDYGSGYGMLVRDLRDRGYDCWGLDAYANPIFSQDFTIPTAAAARSRRFELITAFEVFEHVHKPFADLSVLSTLTDSIFFSTTVLPHPLLGLSDWPYFALSHGQHVCFYSRRGIARLAERWGMRSWSIDNQYHILTRRPIGLPAKFAIRHLYQFKMRSFTKRFKCLDLEYRALMAELEKRLG
jgi:hypothetical protein